MAEGRGTPATDGFALDNALCKLPEALNNRRVVAGASEIHRGLEVLAEFGAEDGIHGAAEVDLNSFDTGLAIAAVGSDFLISEDLGLPALTGFGVGGGGGFGGIDGVLDVEVHELLGLILGETGLAEEWGDLINEDLVDGVAFGRGEGGVGFDLRRVGSLGLSCLGGVVGLRR